MEELNDKEFDEIFKSKINGGHLDFEEASWQKMEAKLRRRDRLVFFKQASIVLIFLSLAFSIYYFGYQSKLKQQKTEVQAVVPIKDKPQPATPTPPSSALPSSENNQLTISKQIGTHNLTSDWKRKNPSAPSTNQGIDTIPFQQAIFITRVPAPISLSKLKNIEIKQSGIQLANTIKPQMEAREFKRNTLKKFVPTVVSFAAGPDFSSTQKTLGGEGGLATGVGLGWALSQKLTIQTGVLVASKKYAAKGYDYSFNNPNIANTISKINALCKVIEVPLKLSYLISENKSGNIFINSGLSSYFMLKENYRFIYTPQSGRPDRFLEQKNENQHLLSVVELSATYQLKLKDKKFSLAIEPYVKIPLSGIGAGNVPLKSSGISLKVNYALQPKK